MRNNDESYIKYLNDNYNKYIREDLLELIKYIPESNGSRYYEKHKKNIAIITDEFMFNYYKDGVNLIYINYYNYKSILENNTIDMFMFVSCWSGMENNDWRGGIPLGPLKKDRIYEVIDICKSKNIPTIFQSIEDPSDYNTYIDIAKKCDYIFTSDSNKIEDYKKDCNNENVFVMEFGINPIIQNPIGMKNEYKQNAVLFAGSYMRRFEERCNDMEQIFDGVLEYGRKLNILDRNFDLGLSWYGFPYKYVSYISPGVNHEDLQKIHKLYDWVINLNSIKYSPTMCAMRIYESQALGNAILSNYSLAVETYNPNVFIIKNKEDVIKIFTDYNKEETYEHQIKSIRHVMSNQTVFERLNYIISIVDSTYNKDLDKKILVVTEKITPHIEENFNKQTYKNKFLLQEENAIELSDDYDFVAYFNANYNYGENYLQDMVNGFKYTNSDFITKDCYLENGKLIPGIEHNYINEIKDKYKTIFDLKIYPMNFVSSINNKINLNNGYSIDHFQLEIINKK